MLNAGKILKRSYNTFETMQKRSYNTFGTIQKKELDKTKLAHD